MIGVDEVGRGCLAGPMLVVAARQKSKLPAGVKDSKKLKPAQREKIFKQLVSCCEFGEGWVSAAEIDELGLTSATKLGVRRALKALAAAPEEQLIIDGHINYAPENFTKIQTIIGGDALVPIVSCASIAAKVTRDAFMHKLAKRYPDYGFEKHVGYGTAFHLAAIESLGSIDNLHRLSFAPMKELADGYN